MKFLLAGSALALAFPVAAQQAAHEHGAAELRVAVDGNRLLIELESPLDNLVGFEHAPRTDKQREALADAEARLRGFTDLFVLPAAAGCELTDVELESPYPQAGAAAGAGHAHDHKHAHDHTHAEGHSEIHVSYELECADPAALRELRVDLVGAFPRMHRIRAETATDKGQAAVTLDKARRSLPL